MSRWLTEASSLAGCPEGEPEIAYPPPGTALQPAIELRCGILICRQFDASGAIGNPLCKLQAPQTAHGSPGYVVASLLGRPSSCHLFGPPSYGSKGDEH